MGWPVGLYFPLDKHDLGDGAGAGDCGLGRVADLRDCGCAIADCRLATAHVRQSPSDWRFTIADCRLATAHVRQSPITNLQSAILGGLGAVRLGRILLRLAGGAVRDHDALPAADLRGADHLRGLAAGAVVGLGTTTLTPSPSPSEGEGGEGRHPLAPGGRPHLYPRLGLRLLTDLHAAALAGDRGTLAG